MTTTAIAGSVSIYDERRVSIQVGNVEPLPLVSKRKLAPHGIIILYGKYRIYPEGISTADIPWAWTLISARVYGPECRPDGGFHNPPDPSRTFWPHENKPQWVQELIDEYRPTD